MPQGIQLQELKCKIDTALLFSGVGQDYISQLRD
ncbi:hypothetical protein CODIS_18220 [Candidatus Thiodiazotropha endolucinida]|uniref:Uncharacterized protein n=1 Tax=Candidatus Thiodiazotropha endolucinida TaxID=1655433 RepID=A0A7Z1AG08_9GAMM|nr:hypothetical protein CODIS_18220 [Candidatus Thiodiazotropha endolucinida]